MAGDDYLTLNRLSWDDRAAAHAASSGYSVDRFVDDPTFISHVVAFDRPRLGDLTGVRGVHLQCHIGTDTIGWARRGARVVGLDFSVEAIAIARELSARCDLDTEWVRSDVYDAVAALSGRTFDVVYTGIGALGWLPDLHRWAEVARSLLRPGGVLYVVELHPMWVAVLEDGRTIHQHAIDAPFRRWDEDGRVSYADPGRPLTHTASYERLHSISDLLSALLAAGLVIELFHEFDVTPAPTPWLERGGDRLYRFPEGTPRFPLTYSVRARRPTT
jgi:SAM-dependent methyltransferase